MVNASGVMINAQLDIEVGAQLQHSRRMFIYVRQRISETNQNDLGTDREVFG